MARLQGQGRFANALRLAYIRPAMSEFLNVHLIRKIAITKGCSVERTRTVSYRHFVEITDPKGRLIEGPYSRSFSLCAAKRVLEAMPAGIPVRISARKGTKRSPK